MAYGNLPEDQESARRILRESIEEGLGSVLGESGAEMLAKMGSLERFARNPEELHVLLVDIFSEKGAILIEKAIARKLLDKVGAQEREPKVLIRFAATAGLTRSSFRLRHPLRTIGESMRSTAVALAEAFAQNV